MRKTIILFSLVYVLLLSYSTLAADCGGITPCSCGDSLTSSRILNASDSLTECSATALIILTSNLTLDCNGTEISGDGGGSQDDGIEIYPDKVNITIKNCIIHNFSDNGIQMKCINNDSIIENNSFYDVNVGINIYPGFYGPSNPWLGRCTNVTITNNHVINASYGGIYVNAHHDSYITNNIISYVNSNRGLYLTNSSAWLSEADGTLIVSNNIIENCSTYYGCASFGNITGSFHNNTITNCTGFYGGVYISQDRDAPINITNNNITNSKFGLYMENISELSIWHNNIFNNTVNNSYSSYAIELSYNNLGNYWGHSECPLFTAGNDSNAANVVDSYPYNETNAWLKGYDPDECDDSSSCGGSQACSCGDFLTESRTITSADNLTNCQGNALNITSNDVTLDCNNYNISGNGTGIGIYSGNQEGITIINCNLSNFSIAVDFDNVNDSIITDNIISINNIVNNANYAGIKIDYCDNVTVNNTNIHNNKKNNIYLNQSESITIQDNNITDSTGYGIYVDGSPDSQITNNNISDNTNNGIRLTSESDDCSIINNTINDNGNYAIYNSGSHGTIIDDNVINDEYSTAIYFTGSNHTLTRNNEINASSGLFLVGAETLNHTFTNNLVEGGNFGLSISDTNTVNISYNSILDIGNDSIRVDDTTAIYIHNNTISAIGHSVSFDNVNSSEITNNTMSGPMTSCIKLISASTSNTISGNNIYNQYPLLSPAYHEPGADRYGIQIEGSSNSNDLISNTIECNTTETANKDYYGIFIYESDNNELSNNEMSNCRGGHYFLYVDNVTLNNEYSYDNYYGSYLSQSGPGTIIINNSEYDNNCEGIHLLNSYIDLYDTNFTNSTCSNNAGLNISSGNVTLQNSNFINNGLYGIYGQSGRNVTWTINDSITCRDNNLSFYGVEPTIDEGTLTQDNCTIYINGVLWQPASTTCGGSTICSCGDSLTESRVLTGADDLEDCDGNGLNISAEGVTLDCNGHNIIGNGTGSGSVGINIQSYDNVTIKNCIVSNYSTAIKISGTNTTIRNNTIFNASTAGLNVQTSNNLIVENDIFNITSYGIISSANSDNIISENDISGYCNYGIYLTNEDNTRVNDNFIENCSYGTAIDVTSSNISIVNNTYTNNTNEGIYLWNYLSYNGSSTIENNTIIGSGDHGIYLYLSRDDTIRNNRISKNGQGIEIAHSGNINLYDNTINNNTNDGILILNSSNGTISGGEIYDNNLADSSAQGGLRLYFQSYNNSITGVYLHNNKKNAIYQDQSNNNTIENNNIDDNCGGNAGIYNYQSHNTEIRNNNITNGTGYGIEIFESTNLQITNNNISDNTNNGIRLTSESDDCSIINNTINDNGNYAIYNSGSHGTIIDDNVINDEYSTAIYFTGSNHTLTRNNEINASSGLFLVGAETLNHTFTNNLVEGGNFGLSISDTNTVNISYNSILDIGNDSIRVDDTTAIYIHNNTISAIGHSVSFDNVNSSEITNNTMSGPMTSCIKLISASTSNTISGNNIYNQYPLLSPAYHEPGADRYGIQIEGSSNSNDLISNTIECNTTETANKDYYGIFIYESDNNELSNNEMSNCRGGHYFLYVDNVTLNNEYSYDNYYGSYLSQSGPGTIIINNSEYDNNCEGIHLLNSYIDLYDTNFTNSTCSNNAGLNISSGNVTLQNSNFINNGLYGIYGQSGRNVTWTINDSITCRDNNLSFYGVEPTIDEGTLTQDNCTIYINGVLWQPPLSSCGGDVPCECGDILNVSRVLNASDNLINCSGNALNITSDDVTLDCNNTNISGNGTNIGIYAGYRSGITIQNCTIKNFDKGIDFDYVNDSSIIGGEIGPNNQISDYVFYGGITLAYTNNITISGIYLHNNSKEAIHLQGVNNVTVENNHIDENCGGEAGIYIDNGGSDNTIQNNNITNGTGYGIEAYLNSNAQNWDILSNTINGNSNEGVYISNGKDITISGNTINSNGGGSNNGIHLDGNDYVTITNNIIKFNSNGFYLENSNNGTITRNTFQENQDNGIQINTADNITLTDNDFIYNDQGGSDNAGVWIESSTRIYVDNNDFNETFEGIHFGDSDNCEATDNTIGGAFSNSGIHLEGINSAHLVQNNTINNSASSAYGIWIEEEHNRIYNNTIYCVDMTIDSYGVYLNNDNYDAENNTFIGNEIYRCYYGLYDEGVMNFTADGEDYHNNSYGFYLSNAGDESDYPTIKNSEIFNSLHGVYLDGSFAKIEETNFSNNTGSTRTGIHVSGDSTALVTNGDFINNGDYAMYDPGPALVNWTITGSPICRDNDISIYGEIKFEGGSLEMDNCTISINGSETLNKDGIISSLHAVRKSVPVNTPTDFGFNESDTNITLYLGSGVTSTVTITNASPTSSGTTASLTSLKGIDISVDQNTNGSLNWALIKIFYNDSELAAAGIDESTLKMYFYNETSGDWQLEPNQGVNSTANYIWANVTHFSTFGVFGGTAPTTTSGGGGGGTRYSTFHITLSPQGYGKILNRGEKVTFYYSNIMHTVTLKSIKSGKATILIASIPSEHVLSEGDSVLKDLDSDGDDDVEITLVSIKSSSATLEFKSTKVTPPQLSPSVTAPILDEGPQQVEIPDSQQPGEDEALPVEEKLPEKVIEPRVIRLYGMLSIEFLHR
ncbi:right-handed parallel beta-helix repeat-containing protein, partial [Nanoarchaeota archaeon]